MGFPSTLISRMSEKLDFDDPNTQEYVDWKIWYDNFNFWAFMCGIYMDDRPGQLKYIGMWFGGMIFGLIIERQSLNWLKTRFGCTYNKLQKFIELDIRRKALKFNWEI